MYQNLLQHLFANVGVELPTSPALHMGISEPKDAGATRGHGVEETGRWSSGVDVGACFCDPFLLGHLWKGGSSYSLWNAPLGTLFFDFSLTVLASDARLSDLRQSL